VARDITEGRPTRAVAVDVGLSTVNIWQNTGDSYDCAIAGIPFLTAISDERPYQRATSPFRKQQFDSQRDPGEQSLSTWWLRSQSSFHAGEGILFYDPLANPYSTTIASNSYRIKESYGVDIWTQGQVTLLHDTTQGHITTHEINTNGRVNQHLRSITYNGTNGVLLHDGYDIDRVSVSGTVDHWVDNTTGGQDKVYSLCDDGKFAYWITNDASTGKLEINKKLLTAASTTAPTVIVTTSSIAVTNAVIDYVKQRLVFAANNFVYEMPSSATNFNQARLVYTHPSTSFIFTSITESGTAIYIAGYEGIKSSIFRFSLDTTNGTMPTLTSAITAAEMPVGETINKIYEYLGYMMIGTNKGIRVARIQSDGSLTYGPLIVELEHGCYDFAARDRFVWCATGVSTIEPGLIRIDLSNEIETLRFAYANDLFYDTTTHNITTAVAFFGDTQQLAFCTAAEVAGGTVVNKALSGGVATLTTATAHNLTTGEVIWVEGVDAAINSANTSGYVITNTPSTTSMTFTVPSTSTVTSQAVTSSTALVKRVGSTYLEHATQLRVDGYLQTGLIRYNTLEPKNFKRIVGQGSFAFGSMSIQTVDVNNNIYDGVSYDAVIGNPEVVITQPAGSQDAIGLRFRMYRDAIDNTKGPVFKGYQLKAVPATPRTRIISIPLMNYDTETDKYNSTLGYEGRAIERLAALENAESGGDVVTFQDFRTGEIRQCLIEEIKFTDTTPPDKRFTGYGGIINLTIRTV
jgi:hypothetical protein